MFTINHRYWSYKISNGYIHSLPEIFVASKRLSSNQNSMARLAKSLASKQHLQGLMNVLIEHHPTIGAIIPNRYLEVMFKIPKTFTKP